MLEAQLGVGTMRDALFVAACVPDEVVISRCVSVLLFYAAAFWAAGSTNNTYSGFPDRGCSSVKPAILAAARASFRISHFAASVICAVA